MMRSPDQVVDGSVFGLSCGGEGVKDHHCDVCPPFTTVFCPVCGKADRTSLGRVRLAGFVGVAHSTSPAIERFFATGDPSHLKSKA